MSQGSLLLSNFLGALASDAKQHMPSPEKLMTLLVNAHEQAKQQWPALTVSAQEFMRHMAEVLHRHPPKKGIPDWFAHLQAHELYLACGCLQGLHAAMQTFETYYAGTIRAVIDRFQNAISSAEDLYQIVQEKLFVGTASSPPKLRQYAGQGFLENWLRVTSMRVCLDVVRGEARQKKEVNLSEELLQDFPDIDLDVELAFLKREYRAHFKEAFAQALYALPSGERNLLRQHFAAGLSLDQIAEVSGVHRSTVARRLAKTRQGLLEATRQAFMNRLQISVKEFDSIMGLIQSRLEVSMHRLLKHSSDMIERPKNEKV